MNSKLHISTNQKTQLTHNYQKITMKKKFLAIVTSLFLGITFFSTFYGSLIEFPIAYASEFPNGSWSSALRDGDLKQMLLPVEIFEQQGGTIRYVTVSGDTSAANDCTNSAAPCSIQRAVDAAINGDEIHVAGGIYNTPVTVDNKTAIVVIGKSVFLRGGYDSNNWASPPDSTVHETILDGNNSNRVVHLYDSGPTIEGFTIRNGLYSFGGGAGAGIYASNVNQVSLIQNKIHHNNASSNFNTNGGGIYVSGSGIISGNTIFDNLSTGQSGINGAGGGIYSSGNVTITNNLVYSNTANLSGAGIYATGNPKISENQIFSNTNAFWGSGLYLNGEAQILNNWVYNNQASNSAAGILVDGTSTSPVVLHNNTIISNTANSSSAIQINSSILVSLSHNIVVSNVNSGGGNQLQLNSTTEGQYNNIYPSESHAELTNTLNHSPSFSDLANFDLHLANGDANIDAGNINIAPANLKDIDGDSRPCGAQIDIGADEYCVVQLPTDEFLSSLVPSKNTAIANGTDEIELVITLRDTGNNPVFGHVVGLDVSNSLITPTWPLGTLTDSNGVITASVSSQLAQSTTITATDLTDNVTVNQTATVSFEDAPISSLAIVHSGNAVIGQAVQFTATVNSQATNVNYSWNFGDSSTIWQGGPTINHTYQTPGEYDVVVTATNTASTQSATTNITMSSPAGPDLTIQKSAPSFVEENGIITYTLTVENQGQTAATGVLVSDVLPVGLTYLDSDGIFNGNSNTATWTTSSLAAGSQVSFFLSAQVTATAGSQIVNSATVSGDLDDFLGNNSANHTLDVLLDIPNLNISLSDNLFYLAPNQTDNLTITVVNNGSAAANNLAIDSRYSWISTTTSFPRTLGQGATLQVLYTINTEGLTEGRYEADITIVADNVSSQERPTTIQVGNFASNVAVNITNDTGAAVANADVTLSRLATRPVYQNGVFTGDEVVELQDVTYFDGHFDLSHVPVGTYSMTVTADQHDPLLTTVEVLPGTTLITASLTAYPTIVFEPANANTSVLAGSSDYIQVNVRNLGPGIATGFDLADVSVSESWMNVALPPNANVTELLPGDELPVTIFLNPPENLAPNYPVTFEGNQVSVTAANISQAAQLDFTVNVVDVATGTLEINVFDQTYTTTVPLSDTEVTLISQTPRTVQLPDGTSYQTTDWQTANTDNTGIIIMNDLPAGSYNIYAESDGYYSYVDTTTVAPGEVNASLGINQENIGLQQDPFNFVWTVIDGQITDTYDITIVVTTEEGELPYPALFASSELIEVGSGSQSLTNSPMASAKGAGLLKVVQQQTDSGDWLIVNMGLLPITNLELNPEFGDFSFTVDTSPIPTVLEPGQAITVPFSVSLIGDVESQPCRGTLYVSGSYQIPFLGWEWDIYRTNAPIYRQCQNEGDWEWTYENGKVTGTYQGSSPPRPRNAPPPAAPGGEAAQLILSGNASLIRQALWANLTLQANQNLTGVEVDIEARNSEGAVPVGGFAVTPTLPTLLNGNGQINVGESVSQQWLLVPGELDITDLNGEPFTIRGQISYDGGDPIQTTAETIQIYPQPRIELKYRFSQPDDNNRFTIQVEAVNNGFGIANGLNLDLSNVTILPDLDGNDFNLTYQLLETSIDGVAAEKQGYVFNFGDVYPDTSKIGRWEIEIQSADGSPLPLQMLVTGFSVSCSHRDYQGLELSTLIVNCGEINQYYLSHDCPFCGIEDLNLLRGGPINTFNGNYDISQSAPGVRTVGLPLQFNWTYNSLTAGIQGQIPITESIMGLGWTHNYNLMLDLTVTDTVTFRSPRGNQYEFWKIGDEYHAAVGVRATLEETPTGFILTARNQMQYIFNADGQIIQQIDFHGNAQNYIYNGLGQLERVVDPNSNRGFDFAYHADNGFLASVTDPISRTTTFGYDENLSLNTITDTRGLVWSYEYIQIFSGQYLLSKVTDPDNRVVEETGFDTIGRAITQTFDGVDLTIEYFDDGRRIITYGSPSSTYVSETLVYNHQGTIIAVADGDKQLEVFELDGNQNRVLMTDRRGYSTQYAKNELGYTNVITDSLGQTTSLAYDSNNNWTQITDGRGHSTYYNYDENNNLITQTNQLSDTVTYTYNAFGQETSMTNELGLSILYGYDAIGQLIVITNTQGLTETFAYDDAGRVITTTSTTGQITINTYDEADNLIQIIRNYHPNGIQNYLDEYNLVTQYDYDGAGRPISMTDTVGLTTFTVYDDFGREIAQIGNYNNPLEADPLTLCNNSDQLRLENICTQTQYDDLGRIEAQIDSLGRIERTFYNQLGQVMGMVENSLLVTSADQLDECFDPQAALFAGLENPETRDHDLCTAFSYDAAGNNTLLTDSSRQKMRTFYDALGQVEGVVMNWDGSLTLDQCFSLSPNRDDNVCILYGYDEIGNTIIITDSTGMMVRTFYDDLNREVATVTNWNPATLQDPSQCHLAADNMDTENICSLTGYNEIGQTITQTNALGQTNLAVYDEFNRPMLQVANWDGTLITEESDCQIPAEGDSNLCSITHYDSLGRPDMTINPMGQTVEFSYDSLSRVMTTTRYLDGQPLQTVVAYNAIGLQDAVIDPLNHAGVTIFDEIYRPVAAVSPEGTIISQTYDIAGRMISAVNNLGHTTIMTYDNVDRLASQQDAEGHVTRFEYDVLGNQIAIFDAEGVQTSYGYDGLQRLVLVTENDTGEAGTRESNIVTQYSYDLRGNLVRVVNGRELTSTNTIYDVLGRPITITDAVGNSTSYTYNAIGQPLTMMDGNGELTTYKYDGLNRLITTTYSADNEQVIFTYNALGQRVKMDDGLGATVYGYDDLNRLTTVTDPYSQTLAYRYDAVGNRTGITYPDGKVVTYTYDADYRLQSVEDWDNLVTGYEYDVVGRLITTTMPNGVISINTYDDNSRLINLRHEQQSNGDLLAEFSYQLDEVGNRLSTTETIYNPLVIETIDQYLEQNGLLVLEAENGSQSQTSHIWQTQTEQTGYDGTGYIRVLPDAGQKFEETDLVAAPQQSFAIYATNPATYTVWIRGMAPDAAGDSVHIMLNGQPEAEFLTGFNDEWSWSSTSLDNSPMILDLSSSGSYTLSLAMREDGLRIDRLLLVTDTNFIPNGTGPAASPLQTISNTIPATTTTTVISYQYDDLYRLLSATYTGAISASYEYEYDAVGNMLAYTDTVNTESGGITTTRVTRSYDDANRLQTSLDFAEGTTSYIYDNNGNLIRVIPPDVVGQPPATVQEYTYNQRNLMMTSSVSQNGITQTQALFTYDGANNRLQQTEYEGLQPTVITYTNDILGLSQVLVANDGTETTYNVFGYDLLSQQTNQELDKRYPIADGLGSVRLEMVANEVEAVRTYDPYGNLLISNGILGTEYGYTGEQEDSSTGLLYLRARYYNPQIRAFMGRDPWGGNLQFPQSMNGWSYVENNPSNKFDPSGLIPAVPREFPEHCRLSKSYPAYGDCVRSYYGLYYEFGDYEDFIRDNNGFFNPNPVQGCYEGPVPYRGAGYIEGVSAELLVAGAAIGLERVYDFASMEEQSFVYWPAPTRITSNTIMGAANFGNLVFEYLGNISLMASTGYLEGFRSWIGNNAGGIVNDYSGWFSILSGQTNIPGTWPLAGGVSYFWGDPDDSISGYSISFGLSANPLASQVFNLSTLGANAGLSQAYYQPIGQLYNIYEENRVNGWRSVDRGVLARRVLFGWKSPLTTGTALLGLATWYTGVGGAATLGLAGGIMVSRVAVSVNAMRWANVYNAINRDSFISYD